MGIMDRHTYCSAVTLGNRFRRSTEGINLFACSISGRRNKLTITPGCIFRVESTEGPKVGNVVCVSGSTE
jgi:hypothetical protein